MRFPRNVALLYGAAFLRSASIGLLGVVLAVYLSRTGFSATAIGLVLAAGLAGSAAATAITSRYGDRFGRRLVLIVAALVSACGGLALAFVHSLAVLVVLAFVCAIRERRMDVITALPTYEVLRFVDCSVFLYSFWKTVIQRKQVRGWFAVKRY